MDYCGYVGVKTYVLIFESSVQLAAQKVESISITQFIFQSMSSR